MPNTLHTKFRVYWTITIIIILHYVVFDEVQSEKHRVDCGVPQGSILGPLLFILNMKDMCNVSKLIFTILYADDTCFT